MSHIEVFEEKCTGCYLCELACSLKHSGISSRKNSMIRIRRDEFKREEIPIVCTQCEEHPCIESCPTEAFVVQGRFVAFVSELCTVCGVCVDACPYSAIFLNDDGILKCDLCGGDPECVKFCLPGALVFVKED